jgi:hypothetical protein
MISRSLEDPDIERLNARVKKSWAEQAPRFDNEIGFGVMVTALLFGPGRKPEVSG